MSRLTLICALALALSSPAAAQDLAISAGQLVVDAEKGSVKGGVLLIRGGKVVSAGANVKLPAGTKLLKRPGAWIVPGFVDARAHLGLERDIDERSQAFANDIDLADRVVPGHKDFAKHRAAGITTALISPGDQSLLAGAAVPVKTTGALLGTQRVAKLSLTSSASMNGRPPTSQGGRLALLRATLKKAHATKGGGPLEAFARGDVPGLVSVSNFTSLEALQRLAPRFGLRLIYDLQASVSPRTVKGVDLKGVFLAIGPGRVEFGQAARQVPAVLNKAGAKVLFTSRAPYGPASGMRLRAIQAAKDGLSGAAALAGLTSIPAQALGLEGRVGALTPGADGDFVVFSGPPLDLRSRVLEVYVAGRRVYRADGEE
ncbi:MAG: amidohydrolase family protein [Planctomycetes bacterium]|nr:amidohydrolase family protein [Planctomycetota bacterium]